jgi:hypothetical protein
MTAAGPFRPGIIPCQDPLIGIRHALDLGYTSATFKLLFDGKI